MPDDRRAESDTPSRRAGAVLWPGATALAVCLFWTLVESRRLGVPAPFEDAAMLFKYAENLAHGFGITWNPGQAPGLTDGATDLGFVLALAPLTYFGLSTVVAALLLNLAAVFGIGMLFGVLNNVLWHRPLWLPVTLAALVAGGPANRYVLSGFSPPPDGPRAPRSIHARCGRTAGAHSPTLTALAGSRRRDRGDRRLVAA